MIGAGRKRGEAAPSRPKRRTVRQNMASIRANGDIEESFANNEAAADGPPHFGSRSFTASWGGPQQSRSFAGKGQRMKFQVFGCGRLFDVDACGVGTGFKFDWMFRRGERHGQRTLDRSGFHLHLGDATKLTLDQQVGIATQFLTSNREAIVRLRQWPGLEEAKVMLSPEHPMRHDVVGSPIIDIPLALMRICTDMQLEIALGIRYKWMDRPE
jgi:hypothetical protein